MANKMINGITKRITNSFLTFDAARTIIQQARLFDVETGGLLIGILKPHIVVLAAGSPGKNAVHHASQFTSDPEADKACLAKVRSIHGDAVIPVGWWHKHPCGLNKPSGGDRHQACQLVQQYADDQPVLMGIVNQVPRINREKTTLFLYSIDAEGNLRKYDWKLVSCSNPQLLDALHKAPVRPEVNQGNYWTNKDFQFYLTPAGRERIKLEVGNLKKADWKVITCRRCQDHAFVLDLLKQNTIIRLVLPPEFPLNPPGVFTADKRCFRSLNSLNQWNSQRRLTEVVAEAAAILHCEHCCQQYLLPI